MIWFVGLNEKGWRALLAYQEVKKTYYDSRVFNMDVVVLERYFGEEEKGIVGVYLPTENIHLSSQCIYYNIPNRSLVIGTNLQKTDEIVIANLSNIQYYFPAGKYTLAVKKFKDVFDDFAWRLKLSKQIHLPSASNMGLFISAVGKKIADAVIAEMQLREKTVDELFRTKWFEWLVFYFYYILLREKLSKLDVLQLVADEQISLDDIKDAFGRTYSDFLYARALDEIFYRSEEIIRYYTAHPDDPYLVDADHRNLNKKVSGMVFNQTSLF